MSSDVRDVIYAISIIASLSDMCVSRFVLCFLNFYSTLLFSFFFFFFFQAEDGIRDLTVTGVQTCALPIFGRSRSGADRKAGHERSSRPDVRVLRALLEPGRRHQAVRDRSGRGDHLRDRKSVV